MIRPGGRFYLFDVVFPSTPPDLAPEIDRWVWGMAGAVGPQFAAEVETHFRDEHSTYDWVLEGMLARAGFRVDRATFANTFEATYLCTRLDAPA
jgi:putative AdoMet-dependent methyltransferase